jgi:hypothetical protein
VQVDGAAVERCQELGAKIGVHCAVAPAQGDRQALPERIVDRTRRKSPSTLHRNPAGAQFGVA